MKLELEAEKRVSSQLVETLKIWQPLVKVGSAIRQRFLETSTRDYNKCIKEDLPLDDQAIEEATCAAHEGDFIADQMLYDLEIINSNRHAKIFEKLYLSRPKIKQYWWREKELYPRITKWHNMRATAYGYWFCANVEECTPLSTLFVEFKQLLVMFSAVLNPIFKTLTRRCPVLKGSTCCLWTFLFAVSCMRPKLDGELCRCI